MQTLLFCERERVSVSYVIVLSLGFL
jgi:hypothetical protein